MIGPQTKQQLLKRRKEPFKKLTGSQNAQLRKLTGLQSPQYIRRMRALLMKGRSFAQAQEYIRQNPK
tara:strand:- start:279 stop:479 length:201 start_codon:yes stop_codon:yes gene_type:complete